MSASRVVLGIIAPLGPARQKPARLARTRGKSTKRPRLRVLLVPPVLFVHRRRARPSTARRVISIQYQAPRRRMRVRRVLQVRSAEWAPLSV